MGRAVGTARVTMEMTWENLTKLYTLAAQYGSEGPSADTAADAIVTDGLSLGAAFIVTVKESPGGGEGLGRRQRSLIIELANGE